MPPRLLLPALLLTVPLATAQQASITTLKSQTRLVVVDVVVTGKDHAPVNGLHQSDFTVLDQGQPQTLKVFEEHTRLPESATKKIAPLPIQPPGVFTNFTNAPQDTALNVLLLDAINTPLGDRISFNLQVQRFLDHVRPGSMMAVFSLSTKLSLLQGFTTDPALVRASITGVAAHPSPVLEALSTGTTQQSDYDRAAENGTPANALENLQTSSMEIARFQLRERVLLSFQQFNILAHYLGNIPGRKNLIWATAGFPLAIPPRSDSGINNFRQVDSFEDQFAETTRLLSTAQVSVYPLDTAGVAPSATFAAANETMSTAINPARFNQGLNDEFTSASRIHDSMTRLAQATGGEAFYNTNGFAQAVTAAMDTGGHFYTLAYSPTDAGKKDHFRKIEVKLAAQGYTLAYRRGYYPDLGNTAPTPSTPDSDSTPTRPTESFAQVALRQAMGFGTPGVNGILFKIRVLPAATPAEDHPVLYDQVAGLGFVPSKPPYRRYLVDFAAAPGDIVFTRNAAGSYEANLEFISIAYQSQGGLVSRARNVIHTTLTPAGYAALAQTGFTFHQEISVPAKGDFTLRVGVQDTSTTKVGSVELALAPIRTLPPMAPVLGLQTNTPALKSH